MNSGSSKINDNFKVLFENYNACHVKLTYFPANSLSSIYKCKVLLLIVSVMFIDTNDVFIS